MKRCKHKFIEYAGSAVGYWQKRDCPGDGVYFEGHAERCEKCPLTRFVCADERYRIVEVEYDPQLEAFLRDGIVK